MKCSHKTFKVLSYDSLVLWLNCCFLKSWFFHSKKLLVWGCDFEESKWQVAHCFAFCFYVLCSFLLLMSVLDGMRHLQYWQIYRIWNGFIHIILYDEAGGSNKTWLRASGKVMAEDGIQDPGILQWIAGCVLPVCFIAVLWCSFSWRNSVCTANLKEVGEKKNTSKPLFLVVTSHIEKCWRVCKFFSEATRVCPIRQ